SLFLIGLLLFIPATVVTGLAGSLHPGAVSMFSMSNRRVLARDALLAGVIACGFKFGLAAVPDLLGALVPAGRVIRGASFPGSVGTSMPFLWIVADLALGAILLAAAG